MACGAMKINCADEGRKGRRDEKKRQEGKHDKNQRKREKKRGNLSPCGRREEDIMIENYRNETK